MLEPVAVYRMEIRLVHAASGATGNIPALPIIDSKMVYTLRIAAEILSQFLESNRGSAWVRAHPVVPLVFASAEVSVTLFSGPHTRMPGVRHSFSRDEVSS